MKHPDQSEGSATLEGVSPSRLAQRREGRRRFKACFRGDERYRCEDTGCQQRTACVKLVAAWLR